LLLISTSACLRFFLFTATSGGDELEASLWTLLLLLSMLSVALGGGGATVVSSSMALGPAIVI